MLDFLKLLSCILFAVAATLFFKKSFRREVIPDVFGLVLLGILTVSPCKRLVLDSADSPGVFKYAGPFAVITCAWFICYRYRHLFRDASSTSVFMAFLLAILDVRFGLATMFWASLDDQLNPDHFAPSWNVYRVCVSAALQFVRRPLWLKSQLQGTRAKLGPIYVMCLTQYVVDALTLDTGILIASIGGIAVVSAIVAGVLLRPDNSTMLEVFGIKSTHPQRRKYHGRLMAGSFACFIALVIFRSTLSVLR